MKKLTRWDPMRDVATLRGLFDRMADEAMVRSYALFEGMGPPPMDMFETDDAVVVEVMMPGVKLENISVSITEDVLNVRGVVEVAEEEEGVDYLVQERRSGTTSRSVRLPTLVEADQASAELEDGILTITIPKVEDVRTKVVEVKSK